MGEGGSERGVKQGVGGGRKREGRGTGRGEGVGVVGSSEPCCCSWVWCACCHRWVVASWLVFTSPVYRTGNIHRTKLD